MCAHLHGWDTTLCGCNILLLLLLLLHTGAGARARLHTHAARITHTHTRARARTHARTHAHARGYTQTRAQTEKDQSKIMAHTDSNQRLASEVIISVQPPATLTTSHTSSTAGPPQTNPPSQPLKSRQRSNPCWNPHPPPYLSHSHLQRASCHLKLRGPSHRRPFEPQGQSANQRRTQKGDNPICKVGKSESA